MELYSSKLTLLLLWSVFCIWVMSMQVRGDAMTPQKCNTQTSKACQAIIGYVPSNNYDLTQIASLFSLNYTSLLGPNDIDPSLQNLPKLVLPANQPYSILQTCGCVDGKSTVTSANYTVVPDDTLSTIANSLYSGLVTYQEIAAVNGIPNPDLIYAGQVFEIPIPCACFNQSVHGTQPSIFLSYQIQAGDSLSDIAKKYNTSATHLQELNSLPANATINAASVLFIPLSVCKANFSSDASDKDLTVLEGKYELTANGCVQCNCNNGTLHCIEAPSSLGRSCSNITCPNSSLALGQSTTSQGNGVCTVQSCVYNGYNAQSSIMPVLETEQDPSCPIALPPETFYKPPTGLVASPLSSNSGGGGTTPSANSPPTPNATPPTPATNNPNSATMLPVGISFSSWWCFLVASLFL